MASPRTRHWPLLAAALLAALVLLLAAVFHLAGAYSGHFFSIDAPRALIYNAARLGLGLSLFFGCVGAGGLLREGLAGRCPIVSLTLRTDRVILDFFVGASLLNTFWYAAGLFGMLHLWLAAAVQSLALAACAPRLCAAAGEALVALRSLRSRPLSLAEGVERGLLCLMVLVAAGSMAANFAFNALVPGGVHDMYHHYFPYLLQVLERGDTLPNDVWYHFYYTKSQGLFFAASLLSDPLAPQLVSGVFVAAASLCVYSLLRVPLLPRHFALLGVAAFNLAFLTRAWWVSHQKNHLVMLGFFGFLLLLSTRLWQKQVDTLGWGMRWLSAFVACAFILNAPSAFSVALPFAGGLILLSLCFRERRPAAWVFFALCLGMCVGLAVTFALNYAFTGMAEINPFRLFWAHADLPRLGSWISPYLMVALDEGSGKGLGNVAMPLMKLLTKANYYISVFKLDNLAGLLVGSRGNLPMALFALGCLVWAAALGGKDKSVRGLERALAEVAAPSLLFIAATLGVGMVTRQQESFERFTGFGLIPSVLLLLLLWQRLLAASCLRRSWGGAFAGAVCVALALSCAWEATAPVRVPPHDAALAGRFLAGRASMAEVYDRFGALWPPMHECRVAMPKGARIRVMNIDFHSMAPGSPMETEFSFSMGPGWHTAVLESPEKARGYLHGTGLDYFLFDTKVALFDLLAFSPLFARDSLEQNFRVVWRKGGVFLLTWADPQETAPSADMRDLLDTWGAALAASEAKFGLSSLHQRLAIIYDFNGHDPLRVARPPGLPPLKGFQ